MKIRGNTVGTPIKPEKALVKCEGMNDEEKAKARQNIGACSEAQWEDLNKSTSQGRSANYACYTPGWKRVLVTTRGHGGLLTFHTGKNRGQSRVFQNVAIMYSGFVDYPTNDYGSGWGNYRTDFTQKPAIFQLYNNIFGEDTVKYPDRKVEITKVRLGYPVPGTTYTKEDGTEAKLTNPVKCYVDVYLDFDADKVVAPSGTGVGLVMNYSGRSVDYDTLPILEETDATDVGLLGEKLQFTEFELDRDEYISVPKAYVSYLRAIKLMVEETMEISGLYVSGSADCEYLRAKNTSFDDMPYKKIHGTAEAPIVFNDLGAGIYYLSGRFKYGANTSLIGSSLSEGLYVVKNSGTTATVLRVTTDGNFRCYTATDSSGSGKDYNIVTMQRQLEDLLGRVETLERA